MRQHRQHLQNMKLQQLKQYNKSVRDLPRLKMDEAIYVQQ